MRLGMHRARRYSMVPALVRPMTSVSLGRAPSQGRHWRIVGHPSVTSVLLSKPMWGNLIDLSPEDCWRIDQPLFHWCKHITSVFTHLPYKSEQKILFASKDPFCQNWVNAIYRSPRYLLSISQKIIGTVLRFFYKTKSFLNVSIHMFLKC